MCGRRVVWDFVQMGYDAAVKADCCGGLHDVMLKTAGQKPHTPWLYCTARGLKALALAYLWCQAETTTGGISMRPAV